MMMYAPIALPPGSGARRERLVRMPEVMDRTGLSRATIYRKMDRGEFPASRQLGANSVAWAESDLEQWMAAPMNWQVAA